MTNIRLPGQFEEREVIGLGVDKLYNNWHRWYSPAMGRYLEPDGDVVIAGSQIGSPFAYADDSPLRLSDPDGRTVLLDTDCLRFNSRLSDYLGQLDAGLSLSWQCFKPSCLTEDLLRRLVDVFHNPHDNVRVHCDAQAERAPNGSIRYGYTTGSDSTLFRDGWRTGRTCVAATLLHEITHALPGSGRSEGPPSLAESCVSCPSGFVRP
jgi:RHS repeat-associated protein